MKPAKNCQSCKQIITSRSLVLRKRETAEMLLRVENEKKEELRDKNLENKKKTVIFPLIESANHFIIE